MRQTILAKREIITKRKASAPSNQSREESRRVQLGQNLPDKGFRIKVGAMIGKIEAGHSIEIVCTLKITEREWTRQIRRHSHGVEALHGEGRGDGGECAIEGRRFRSRTGKITREKLRGNAKSRAEQEEERERRGV